MIHDSDRPRPAAPGGSGPEPHADFDAFEAHGWENAAATYQWFFDPITDRLIDPLLDVTGVSRGTTLLDVACGHGNLSGRAAARGAHPWGVDVAEAMVASARQAHPGIEFSRADACELPCASETFDVAVSNFAILHLGEPERGVAELARVLAPGGKVALTVWDVPARARLFGWVTEALALAGAEPPDDIPPGPPFFRFADDEEMHRLLEGNGFEKTTIHTIAFTHTVASTDLVWTGIVGGTVRTAALVRNQPPSVQRAIRAAFDEVVARESPGSQVVIPFSVKLASATNAKNPTRRTYRFVRVPASLSPRSG
ncbi:class I SAM-dependent methyltransferase [Nocardia uniformis]|uniref:Class I SAM-dependent methyltransferase n=1 Tax=Nocardia uniformis TaxID=53432 RepID=A0A849BV71_9NOCA|nr:class I SAM-dependent methyltransferase [Nocardia uniformis]NNH68978.1 class I SAM-dependent methyltransferase [Nocardia uniformis]